MAKQDIDFDLERDQKSLVFDTRTFGQRIRSGMAGEIPVVVLFMFSPITFFLPQFTELITAVGLLFFWYTRRVQKSAGLVLQMPKSSNQTDPKEIDLKTEKSKAAQGIIYLGNDKVTDEEVWLTDTQARTHMLFMGTTGSGKTEILISLTYNALIHGSGLIYVDGKAQASLYAKVYSMARAVCREDDVLVINFQTGAKDIYSAQPTKLSNTLNPFAVGSAGMLSELVKGLMASGEKSTWTQQAESFVEAIMKPLVFLRDKHGLNLDVDVIRGYFELKILETLAWEDHKKYEGLAESGVLDGIQNYLITKPGYNRDNFHNQGESTNEQHGFITMQLIRTFNSLADTYGYIMKTPLAEIDFVDVFLNRRILVVLLPALEKSPSELTNLGRIVVASIKATMAKGLGSTLEGSWKRVIDSNPTTAPSPFMCVLDEYGYYAVEGFAVVPAQARSLGFSAIFAGQDLPAFEKASKEEAKSTLANTNTRLCGKLECTQTYEFFKSIAGSGKFTTLSRYERDDGALVGNNFNTDDGIQVDRIDRVSFESLRHQPSGHWHLFYANTIIRMRAFFANPRPVKNLRVNHFITVPRPTRHEIAAFRSTFSIFERAVSEPGGLMTSMDRVIYPADIVDIHEALDLFKTDSSLTRAAKVLAFCAHAEEKRSTAFMTLTSQGLSPPKNALQPEVYFDFAGQVDGSSDVASFDQEALVGEHDNDLWDKPDVFKKVERKGGDASQFHSDDLLADLPDHIASKDDFDDAIVPSDFSTKFTRARNRLKKSTELSETERIKDDFHAQTTVFGIPEILDDPDDLLDDVPNDIEGVFSDEPQNSGAVGFAAPSSQDGLLDRESTIRGIAQVESAVGSPTEESLMTAMAVSENIEMATKYPITVPSKKPNMEEFESVADRLLTMLAESIDD